MTDRRRQLGTFAVLSLVLLRLVIGWHFFREGIDKVAYDSSTKQVSVDFSAAGFLAQAKGPLAGCYHTQAPDVHNWPGLLAVSRQNEPLTADEAAHQAQWLADYAQRRDAATKAKEPLPIEFPPFAPYHDWAEQIVEDWKSTLAKVTAIDGLSDDQQKQAAEAFALRHQQLADYLAGESEAITEYQHELWRLEKWRAMPEAKNLPYQEERIAAKSANTASQSIAWVSQVKDFEQSYFNDLRHTLTSQERADQKYSMALDDALTSPRQRHLEWINLAATILTIGVGICLLLGFFTRLASLVGALFLLAVIASQPPWLADAAPTMNQAIEFAGLLVLAGTGAGRWLGLDFFTYALFSRFRKSEN